MSAGTTFTALALFALALPTAAGAAGLTARSSGAQDMLSGPSPWYDVVGSLDNQQRVDVLQCTPQQRWCLVRPVAGGRPGWVEGSYLIGSAAKNAVSPYQFSFDPTDPFNAFGRHPLQF